MSKHRLRLLVAAACVLIVGFVMPVWAQTGVTLTIKEVNLADNYPDITATISVLNSSGVPIQALTRDRFEVREDGEPLAVRSVIGESNSQDALALALVLDLSGSAPLDVVKQAAHQFLDYLEPGDRVALIGFNTVVSIDGFDSTKEVDFTSDSSLLRQVIDGLEFKGETALYEAVYKGVLITEQEQADRRAVIVMTDGFDTSSREEIATASTPKAAARDRRIPVFTVGVYHPDESFGRNPDYLKVLANESGGRYQEANDPANPTQINSQELGYLFEAIIDQLRLQYTVTFTTEQKKDGKDRVLTLRVTSPQGQQAMAERTEAYPAPPVVAEITRIQEDINDELLDMRSQLKGRVRLVPEINAQNPILKVEYYVDGQLAFTADTVTLEAKTKYKPWEWKWDTGSMSVGPHTLTVIAYDDAGIQSDSYSTSVEIARSGVYLPVVGTVATPVLIGVAGAMLLLVGLFVFLATRQRRGLPLQDTYEPGPMWEPPTVPSGTGSSSRAAGVTMPGLPGQPDSQPGYAPTMPPSASHAGATVPGILGSHPGGLAGDQKTEILRKEPETMAWLVVREGPFAGREFRLSEVTNIGREGNNDIVLDASGVSRQHAKVRLREGTFTIHDLGATNPTKVNGEEKSRHELSDGDRVEIGPVTLIFKEVRPDNE